MSLTSVSKPRVPFRLRRRLVQLTCVSLVALMLLVVAGSPTSAHSGPGAHDPGASPTIEINGGGWGHGRGMGQYGAYGYASSHGWSSARILDHFYQGTAAGKAPAGSGSVDPDRLRVDLSSRIGSATSVQLGEGTIAITDSSGASHGSVAGAVRIDRVDGAFVIQHAASCDDTWVERARTSASIVMLRAATSSAGADGLLKVCGSSPAWYDGAIWTTVGNGAQRTINVVSVEQYLRGVVPNEMPASWPQAALEAQAVAARSYALAGDPRRGIFSDTCDTTYCQVYDGRYTTRGGWRQATHANTDAAIEATRGVVRLTPSGRVARTEFSSSTGGYTAGGDFAAVEDLGDAISANPNSQWSVTLSPSVLENRYGLGLLKEIEVTKRNGLGPFGGRVVEALLRFENGDVTISGDSLRYRLGLKSDLFEIGSVVRPDENDPTSEDPGGSDEEEPPTDEDQPVVVDAEAKLIVRTFERLLGREPSGEELADARSLLERGEPAALADSLAHHPDFAGRLIDSLYRDALGRPADQAGRTYWIDRMQDGLSYQVVGTLFFGSSEYYNRSGAADSAFVDSLYELVLDRPTDDAGRRYWLARMDEGAAPSTVAGSFFRSVESRRGRADALSRSLLERRLTRAERDAVAASLLARSDLTVAAEMALWDS